MYFNSIMLPNYVAEISGIQKSQIFNKLESNLGRRNVDQKTVHVHSKTMH